MESTEAIVTRLTRLTETSLIVHWFTAEFGLLKSVAKGAKRPKSQFAGKLDLFFGGEITLGRSKSGGEWHTLREVVIRDWREGLRRDYTSTLLAAYFCQLLERAVEPNHAEPELYDLLRRALDHLDQSPPELRVLRHFEREMARILGVLHHHGQPEASLRDALGSLPDSRAELMERLPSRQVE